MLCCHCDGAYTAPTPMSSVYQTCCQRQLIGRLSLYDADCELTCHARSSRSFGALSVEGFHALRLHRYRSFHCDPKAYGLAFYANYCFEGLRAPRLHWFRSSAVPRNRMVISITPRVAPALNPAAQGTSLQRIFRIDGGLRSYDTAGGDRMTPA